MEKNEILEEIVIEEGEYQEIKRILHKKDDYFSKEKLAILMQFLLQRQRKSIKKEVKRRKTQKWEYFEGSVTYHVLRNR